MPRAINGYKVCSKCKIKKPISEFHSRNRTTDGLEYSCKSCWKIYADSNRQKLRDADKRYYDENRTRQIAKSRKYGYLSRGNPVPQDVQSILSEQRYVMSPSEAIEHSRNRQRTYRQTVYRETHNQKNREYSRTERGKSINNIKALRYRNRKFNAGVNFGVNDYEFLLQFQRGMCGKCQRKFSADLRPEIDHIIPVILGGELVLHNAQLLCRSCNASKGKSTIRYIPELLTYFADWT